MEGINVSAGEIARLIEALVALLGLIEEAVKLIGKLVGT